MAKTKQVIEEIKEKNITKRKPDPIWDTVCEIFGLNPQTRTEQSRVGKIVSDLKIKEATPDEIRTRLRRYRKEWPKMADTPEALVKHWDRFAKEPRSANPSRVREEAENYD